MSMTPVQPTRRFTAWVLEMVLVIGTAYIGWLIWSLITWGRGQTPAQNLLRIVTINDTTNSPAKRPQMFIRYILIFTAYWFGYFAVSNIAYAINPNGILLGVGIALLLFFHLWDISGILRREDRKRLVDVVSGVGVCSAACSVCGTERVLRPVSAIEDPADEESGGRFGRYSGHRGAHAGGHGREYEDERGPADGGAAGVLRGHFVYGRSAGPGAEDAGAVGATGEHGGGVYG